MKKENQQPKTEGGKPPEMRVTYRYSVNFTPPEQAQFLTLFEQSGLHSKSRFIKARVFDETFRVISIDRTRLDYYQKLSNLFAQFRAVGVNYNQIAKELKSHFTEKKALALLFKLETETKELVRIGREITLLTQQFEQQWSQKSQ